MYVRPISTFFSRGRSTPAIRAMRSALPLLMLGIALADDASHAVALHDLAMLADRLHAAANFHRRAPVERRNFPAKTRTLTGPGTARKSARRGRLRATARAATNGRDFPSAPQRGGGTAAGPAAGAAVAAAPGPAAGAATAPLSVPTPGVRMALSAP